MNAVIERIFSSGEVVGRGNQRLKLHSEIDRDEGRFLYQVITDDPGIRKTLEVGCAYGLASLHICEALRSRAGVSHTILDPFQNSQWEGVGVRHLEECGFNFFQLIEEKSEFALPRLLAQGEGAYDLVFVDGWHTFDHTLIDCFYATRLLRTGGYLLIDDTDMPAVRRVCDYLSWYPCYEKFRTLSAPRAIKLTRTLARTLFSIVPQAQRLRFFNSRVINKVFDREGTRMMAFKKVGADERNWDWYSPRF